MKRVLFCTLALLLALGGLTALAETDAGIGSKLRVVNCEEYITLREEPDTSAAALARIPLKGEAVSLGDRSNGFVRVGWKGQSGWALEKYLRDVEESGTAVSLTSQQRYNLNLFLSNFTEVGFCRREGAYSDAWADPVQLTDFAVDHCWFNRQNRLEWGEYFNYNNVRLPEEQIAPIVKKYFGLSIKPSHEQPYTDYKNGYYYWQETGGHISDGFACLSGAEKLGGGRYCVWFGVYAGGEQWDNDACYYTQEQAWAAYPGYGGMVPFGCAVVDTGSSGLNDRSGWKLVRYAVNYDVWD